MTASFGLQDLKVMYGSQQSLAQYEGIALEDSLTRVQQLVLDVDHTRVRTELLSARSFFFRSQRKSDNSAGVACTTRPLVALQSPRP